MMYDELIAALNAADKRPCSDLECPGSGECPTVGCLFREAADAIEELTAELEYTKRQYDLALEDLEKIGWGEWIPMKFEDGGLTASITDEYDGCWIIVTNGRLVSVERFKKDAYDHFYPSGRWFDLEDVTHWMPLPTPPKEATE